jgi:hypothetical protein
LFELNVAVGRLYELIARLSVATAVNVTVWVLSLVNNATLVILAENEVIEGVSSSTLFTLTCKLSVDVLPAASTTERVNVSVVSP